MQFDQIASPSNFVRLKDGEKTVGVFRGDLVQFRQHWSNNKTTLCTKESGSCAHCEEGKKPSFRFRLNFLSKNQDGAWEAKIFEQGAKVYNTLKGLHESDYNLEKTIVSISRAGSTKDDTVYTILPTRDCDVTPEREAVLAKVVLHPLEPSHGDAADQHESEQIPF